METRLTLRKGIVGIIGDDDFNSGFLKLISKLWEISYPHLTLPTLA